MVKERTKPENLHDLVSRLCKAKLRQSGTDIMRAEYVDRLEWGVLEQTHTYVVTWFLSEGSKQSSGEKKVFNRLF